MKTYFALDPGLDDFLRRHVRDEREWNVIQFTIQVEYLRVLSRNKYPFKQQIPVVSYLFNPAWIDPHDEWWNPSWVPGYHLTFTLATEEEFGFMLFVGPDGKIDEIWTKDYWATRSWFRSISLAGGRGPYIRDILN